MKRFLLLSAALLMQTHTTYSAILVQGNNSSSPFGFNSIVKALKLDRLSGTLYVGLSSQDSPGEFSLSQISRPAFNTKLAFRGVATNSLLNNMGVELLALSNASNIPTVAACTLDTDGMFTQTSVFGVAQCGNQIAQSEILNDASCLATTSGIIALTASKDHIFAAVKGNNSGANFGNTGSNSGIALINVKRTSSDLALTAQDTMLGIDGNRALLFDATQSAIKGDSGSNVTFASGDDANKVALHFDPVFNCSYAGLRITTGSFLGDIAKAVVLIRTEEPDSSKLVLIPIAPDSALNDDTENFIVAAQRDAIDNVDLRIKHVNILHASTGPSYLIVNGGKGTTNQVSNTIFALPLVNNPDIAEHGTLADKTSTLDSETHAFITPATDPSQMTTNIDPEALIGAGTIPIEANNSISDMVIVGDTVYISNSIEADSTNSPGLFYSRAQFNPDGKIAYWTPWTKRALPFNAFPGTELIPEECPNPAEEHDGRITLFAVDGKNGTIWFTEGTTEKNVGVTTWSQGIIETDLLTQLNKSLSDGSYSALDLSQDTRGFTEDTGNTTTDRYALFGGTQKVVFARISQTTDNTTLNSPQTIIEDFSSNQNFLETTLPNDAGCTFCLEYARQTTDEGAQNYFFAGTETGLFFFADTQGNGFNVSTLSTLDQPPFTTGLWQKIETIKGSVVCIKNSGKALYIATQESTTENPLKATVYSIPFAPTTTAMFINPTIIAQTNTNTFNNVFQFFDLAIIANESDPETIEQLALATNQGLFISTTPTGIQDATDQDSAMWQTVENTKNTFFTGIGQEGVQTQQTVWPFSREDLCKALTFTRSSIHQLNSDTLKPQNFNTLDLIYNFWSDGGRRFFILNRLQNPGTQTSLAMLPFNTATWNATHLFHLQYPPLNHIQRLFWIQLIGASGIVMIGTESGIVGLT